MKFITKEIDARETDYCTEIVLEEGNCYSIKPEIISDLFDLNLKSENGTEGYNTDSIKDGIQNFILKNTEFLRKVKEDNWFTLEGFLKNQTKKSKPFKIGSFLDNYEPEFTGTLYCFLNDIPIMYFNNKGSYRLIITKLNL